MTGAAAIPNVFHFVFGLKRQTEPFHLMYYLCLESCLQVNRPDAVFFHHHFEPYGEWWERIKPKLQLRHIALERFVADYDYADPRIAAFRYAHMSDFARLRILHDEGGFYADIDTLFLRPVPSSWRSRHFIIGRETVPPQANQDGSLCNAWLGSRPGSEFCGIWLDRLQTAFDGQWSNHSTLLPYRLSRQLPWLLDVEPTTSFYALDWTPQGIADLFLRHVILPDDAYSLHLWNHLWIDPRRVDFSHFHGNRLTMDYVRFAGSTYAKHARRFLPPGLSANRAAYGWQNFKSLLRHPLHREPGSRYR